MLILGGGVNGAALARELLLNGIPVSLIDAHDIACGATSRSSRLIHGGLRYLEHGDWPLVRESLRERNRLLRLAPQFVHPLHLYIPVRRRTGGLLLEMARFLGFGGLVSSFGFRRERSLWLIRLGLSFYDWLAGNRGSDAHAVFPVDAVHVPRVDRSRYRWLCRYTDAQMLYPERFVVALLHDAEQIAAEQGLAFTVQTYHEAVLRDGTAEISHHGKHVATLRPAVVVNATGAWGDWTLEALQVPAERLFGGTKGSHIVSPNPRLRSAIDEAGLYAEAADGRLVFLLPFGRNVLIGTTDQWFTERPDQAVASQQEVDYLLELANELCPEVHLTRDDVALHYSGVRPLPYAPNRAAGAIPRGHWVRRHEAGGLPVFTLLGGKLTTCRSFAELAAETVLEHLQKPHTRGTRDRVVPGGADYPADVPSHCEQLAYETGFSVSQVRAVWALCGRQTDGILRDSAGRCTDSLPGTDLPRAFAQWVTRHEWVTTLDDLVERRLLLLYHPELNEPCLRVLAECLIEADLLAADQLETAIQATQARLWSHFGKRVH